MQSPKTSPHGTLLKNGPLHLVQATCRMLLFVSSETVNDVDLCSSHLLELADKRCVNTVILRMHITCAVQSERGRM